MLEPICAQRAGFEVKKYILSVSKYMHSREKFSAIVACVGMQVTFQHLVGVTNNVSLFAIYYMLSDEVDEHQLTVEEDGPSPTAHTDPFLDPGNDTVSLVTAGHKLRWGVLVLSCSLLFGNFYGMNNSDV